MIATLPQGDSSTVHQLDGGTSPIVAKLTRNKPKLITAVLLGLIVSWAVGNAVFFELTAGNTRAEIAAAETNVQDLMRRLNSGRTVKDTGDDIEGLAKNLYWWNGMKLRAAWEDSLPKYEDLVPVTPEELKNWQEVGSVSKPDRRISFDQEWKITDPYAGLKAVLAGAGSLALSILQGGLLLLSSGLVPLFSGDASPQCAAPAS